MEEKAMPRYRTFNVAFKRQVAQDVVLINTMRIAGLHLVNNGEQVVCLPGTMLFQLERALRPLGREPHSVIGSSCIGASVFGGICNNSGGALIHRGPAFSYRFPRG
jgi:D-lactate dehydrogenase